MMEIAPALESDKPAIEELLTGAGLPLDGLDAALRTAVVAREAGSVVGCAAVEPYGSVGLLRSVCVAPQLRGSGIGHQLVEAAEEMASYRGVAELYLLTETAGQWFPRLGYEPATRAAVPAPLTASPEFAGACPTAPRSCASASSPNPSGSTTRAGGAGWENRGRPRLGRGPRSKRPRPSSTASGQMPTGSRTRMTDVRPGAPSAFTISTLPMALCRP